MVTPAMHAHEEGTRRDHGYHPVKIGRVVWETADARSFVLELPDDLKPAFAYEAGQFCTLRVVVDGGPHVRCYSMSSAPAIGDELQVTVKRVPGGVVSNWMIDNLEPGDEIEAAPPAGFFLLRGGDGDVVLFGAGSGITPVFSLLKTALATTSRRVRLLYANRDRDSVIFAAELGELVAQHPDRLDVVHHLDVERGFVDAGTVGTFLAGEGTGGDGASGAAATGAGAGGADGADFYVCGPGPFMDIVETTLLGHGAAVDRIHIERFTPAEHSPEQDQPAQAAAPTRVTIEIGGQSGVTDHHPGTTILQTARQMGLSPPFSCESGSCATCMAKLVEGAASMFVNNALTPDEVADGWVLTCQAVPTTASVHVVYE